MSDPNSINNQSAELAALNQQLNQTANLGLSISNSRKSRRFAEQLNRQQREDNILAALWQRRWSLKDWQMQNKYNSPLQQMQRLKEAGLNPHHIS